MSISRDDVEEFLKKLKFKLNFWGVLFRDERNKNSQALLDLNITSAYRIEVIKNLQVIDYSEGPHKDNLYKLSDMWIFGKAIKNTEIYIKISLGNKDSKVICISFHPASSSMDYPFKS